MLAPASSRHPESSPPPGEIVLRILCVSCETYPQEILLPFPALPGLPGSSTDLFLRAVPHHPGRSGECLLIASPPISGFMLSGGLATFTGVTTPNAVRLPGFRQPVYADSLRIRYMYERAIYMVNSFQFTKSARLSLVYPMNTDKQSWSYPCSSVFIRVHLVSIGFASFSCPATKP